MQAILKHEKQHCTREQAKALLDELWQEYHGLGSRERGYVHEVLEQLSTEEAPASLASAEFAVAAR